MRVRQKTRERGGVREKSEADRNRRERERERWSEREE